MEDATDPVIPWRPQCGHSWRPPWIPPPSADPVDVAYYQKHRSNVTCVLPRGHEGDHRSDHKVTTANRGA